MILVDIPTLANVLKIQACHGGPASAFAVKFDDNVLFVTAKHVVADREIGERIEVHLAAENRYFEIADLEYGANDADVAVIRLAIRTDAGIQASMLGTGPVVGQDAIFAGYPLGIETFYNNILPGRPVPLVKSGTFSALIFRKPVFGSGEEHHQYLFDAHNNSGFSGGPIFVNANHSAFGKPDIKIVAVVSGFIHDRIQQDDEHKNVKFNSGFMTAVPIQVVLDAAERIISRIRSPLPPPPKT